MIMPVVARNKGVLPLILRLNMAIFVAMLVLASWSIDQYIDFNAEQTLRSHLVMSYVLAFSLVTALTGVWSVIMGLIHVRAWRRDTLAYAATTVLITWVLTIVTTDVAWREVNMREHGISMRALEALIFMLLVTQPTYIFILCYMTLKYDLRYRNRNIAYRVMDNQTQQSSTLVARPDTI